MKIAIINFNSASITTKMESFKDLYTVKLDVSINEVSYAEKTMSELFDEAEKVKKIPNTSQPTPENFINIYNEVAKNYDKAIILTPDPVLSGTHQAAISALEMIENSEKFHVINTRSFALSEAILCDKAIDMIAAEETLESIISELEDIAKRITTYIIPGSFEYLKMGGRVNLPKLIIGKIMNLKILVEHKEGIADVKTSTRGFKKLFGEISNILQEYDVEEIYAAEIKADEVLYTSLLEILEEYKVTKTIRSSIIMAAHFGPNTIGFAVVEKRK